MVRRGVQVVWLGWRGSLIGERRRTSQQYRRQDWSRPYLTPHFAGTAGTNFSKRQQLRAA